MFQYLQHQAFGLIIGGVWMVFPCHDLFFLNKAQTYMKNLDFPSASNKKTFFTEQKYYPRSYF